MPLDLEAVRIFVKVAELASFTRAAEHLGMAKARASLRVQQLEADLGIRLLQRTTRTVRTTPDGERFLPRARQLVVEAEDIATMFQAARTLRGTVRMDLPVSLARDTIIPRLPELLAAHPLLELQLSTTDRRVDLVREGFDCVLRVGNLADSGLVQQRLGFLPMVNCASAAYVRKRGLPLTLDDLDGHLMVHYGLDLADAPTFEYPDGDRYRLRPMKSSITVNNADAYLAACLAGLGIIQVPLRGVETRLADGSLVEILPELTCEPMPVTLVHGHGRSVPRRVRAVMSWVADLTRPGLVASSSRQRA
jgi:DNA-binding transcriptional LysR family regulator